MMTQVILDSDYKLTPEQLDEIHALKEMKDEEIVFDEDCPELSPSMMKSMRCIAAQRNRLRKAN